MKIAEFEKISIRGRVAYGICCLERALIHCECSTERWKWILEKLWEYTSIEYLDDWYYEISEYLPASILDVDYELEGFEHITKDQFDSMQGLYKEQAFPIISQVCDLIFQIGTIDLYSTLENYSPNTLACLEKINKIMIENQVELPNLDQFAVHSFSENGGWGNCFIGINYSRICNKVF